MRCQRALPGLCRFDSIAGAENQKVRDGPQRRQMFNRLMRWSILAKADRIMRHHIDNALFHQRRQADRGTAIIGKHQEGATIGDRPAMKRDAVHRRRHAMFANAVIDIGAGRIVMAEDVLPAGTGVVGAGQVGRAADQCRAGRNDRVKRLLAGDAGGDFLRVRGKGGFPPLDSVIDGGVEISGHRGVEGGAVGGVMACLPRLACGPAAGPDGAPVVDDRLRNVEWLMGPAKCRARAGDLVAAERCAMNAGCAGLGRCAISNHRAAADQCRSVLFGARLGDGFRHSLHVMPVNGQHLPAIGGEARRGVVGNGEVGAAVDRNAVIIEQHDQPAKPHMTCHRGGLVAYTLHQAAITGDGIGEMVDKVPPMASRQMRFRHRHADGIGKSLAKRAGRRLDAAGMTEFRMTGGDGANLAEVANLRHRHVFVTGQMQQRIDQHRAMAGGQDESVTVRPVRRRGVEFQMVGKQRRGGISHAHGHARVTGFRRFDGIHRQGPDGICHMLTLGGIDHENLLRMSRAKRSS